METSKLASIATFLATGGVMFSPEIRKTMFENPLVFVPAAIALLHLVLSSIGIDVNPLALISRSSRTSSERNRLPED